MVTSAVAPLHQFIIQLAFRVIVHFVLESKFFQAVSLEPTAAALFVNKTNFACVFVTY